MNYYVVATSSPPAVLAVFKREDIANRFGYCTLGSGAFSVRSGPEFEAALGPVKALRKAHYSVESGLRDLFRGDRTLTRDELLLFLQCARPTLDCQLAALRKKNINVTFAHKKKRYVRTESAAGAGTDE